VNNIESIDPVKERERFLNERSRSFERNFASNYTDTKKNAESNSDFKHELAPVVYHNKFMLTPIDQSITGSNYNS